MKRNKIVTVLSGAALLVSFIILLLSCGNQTAQCPLCERDIHRGMQVEITKDTSTMKTCCMACALTYKAQSKNARITKVTDFPTNTPADPQSSVYLVGSDISPCTQDPKVQKYLREEHSAMHACYDRCEPGILAFVNKAEAENFQQQHGGAIRTFDQLMNAGKEDGHDKQGH